MRLFLAAKAVATAAATAGGGGTFTNPVIGASCGSNGPKSWALTGCETPDPGVTRLGDSASSGSARWLALTTTQDANETFARHESSDLAVWTPAGHVWNSTTRPSWGTGNWFAPELHHVGQRWILVFSATWSANGKQAIGAAFAHSAGGPFIDSGAPIAVPHNNTNDPTLAHVGDTVWLVYKAKSPDRIFAQRVEPAGVPTRLQPSGEAVELISADRPWENKCVEAPWLVTNAPNSPWIYLFYAGDFDKETKPPDHKAIGVARSRSIVGPWEKRLLPILHSSSNFSKQQGDPSGQAQTPQQQEEEGFRISPGHCSVVPVDGDRWAIVYHSSLIVEGAHVAGPREMMLDALSWSNSSSGGGGSDGWWPEVDGGADVPSQTARPVIGLKVD